MNRLTWESFSFVPGIHTYHEYQAGGEIFPHDMKNLRADGNGYLRQRSRVHATHTAGHIISGVASDPRNVWVVRDGRVFREDTDLRLADDRRLRPIVGTEGAEGRLWVVSEFRDFVIIKAEADNRGWWIDLREDADTRFQAYPLGIRPPVSAFTRQYESGLVDFLTLEVGQTYVFRLTYLRNFAKPSDILNGLPSADPELFEGAESVLGHPHVVLIRPDGAIADTPQNIVDKDGNSVPVIVANGTSVRFYNLEHSSDPQVTGIALYQAIIPIRTRTTVADRINIDNLVYYLADYLPNTATLDPELRARSDETLLERPKFLYANHTLPDKPAQITYFNDLVFAAIGDELRYTDIRLSAPAQWAWPEDNSIKIESEVLFCVQYRGVLLFGGPHGIWRLTGTDEFNFDNDNISAVGPVSLGVFSKFKSGVGFIATNGFYTTDGVDVQRVSSPHLDGFFEDHTVVDGAVTLLPSNDELWSVRLEGGAERHFLKSVRGGWFGWEDVNVRQTTRFIQTSVRGVRTDKVYNADGEELSEVVWNDFRVDSELSWSWLSNVIDFKSAGSAEALKLFRWLEVSSEHSGDGLLKVWVDDSDVQEIEFEFRADTQRPVRVPLNRRGEKIQFEISGTGEVVVRYLRLVADTRSRRTRF